MTEPQRFTKLPVEVEARQLPPNLHGDNYDLARDIAEWCGGTIEFGPEPWHVIIPSLEGPLKAGAGWWVLKGVRGEFYPHDPDIFAEVYVPAARPQPTDAERRDPAATVVRARDGWTEWLPGDSTSYRVRIDVIGEGPDQSDRVLLVNCVGTTIAVQYVDPQVCGYRAKPWTAKRWQAAGMPKFGGYDAWHVVRPLLKAAGAVL